MQDKELTTDGGSLFYVEEANKVRITGWQGLAEEVKVPEQIGGFPVTEIGKKAFLSKKNLRRITLPDRIWRIDDWAFAYCDSLERVEMSGGENSGISFGKSVFLECSRLKEIAVRGKKGMTGMLLAAAVVRMEAYYLLDVKDAGGREWLKRWDARMLALIRTPDQEGYSKQVLCGEEDYGSTDLEAYMSGRRKEKVRLMFLRLLYPDGLEPRVREELQTYLQNHTKGGESEEAWQVILHEHGDERAYYEMFARIGCLREDNMDAVLCDIGEEYPEMKAFFLRYKKENIGYSDFFGELEL